MLNDRLGQFHEAPISKDLRRRARLGPPRRPTSTPTAAPTWSPPAPSGPVLAWRNTTERTTAEATKLDLRVLADQRRPTGDRPRPSTSTSTAGPTCSDFPPRPSKPGDVALPAWARNEGKRFAARTAVARPRESRPRRADGRRPGRRRTCPTSWSSGRAKPPRWPGTWATASTGWPSSSAATGGSSPS